jgi:Fe-S-cluster containining protein
MEFDCPQCGHCCSHRPWVGLTDDEFDALAIDENGLQRSHLEFVWAFEEKLREKNNG